MNNWQQLAYKDPCFSQDDVIAVGDDRRRRYLHVDDCLVLACLTVDRLGEETGVDACWHASIVVLDRTRQPVPPARVPDGLRLRVDSTLWSMVADVGERRHGQRWVKGDAAFHFYKPLTRGELADLRMCRETATA